MVLKSYELSHPEYMWIRQGEKTLYGCNQDWYGIEWRRRAGCGPVAAANILIYLRKKYGEAKIPYGNDTVDEALVAMNDVFSFVRPCLRGLNTVKKFVNGMGKFGLKYGISFRYRYIVVPPQVEKRPDLDVVAGFIEEGLKNDVPVAFLNLHAGEVEAQLSSWHWVTVVGICRRGDGGDSAAKTNDVGHCGDNSAAKTADSKQCGDDSAASTADAMQCGDSAKKVAEVKDIGLRDEKPGNVIIRFYDQSNNLEVDLGKWLGSTRRGGGFTYFYKPSDRQALSG